MLLKVDREKRLERCAGERAPLSAKVAGQNCGMQLWIWVGRQ